MTALKSFDPTSGELVGELESTPAETIPEVLRRARAAQPGWAALGALERARRLTPLEARLRARATDLASLIAREVGKPRLRALRELAESARVGDELERAREALAPHSGAAGPDEIHSFWDPHGVCAVITTWSSPLADPHGLTLPALAAGNAVVLKPSELAPLTAAAYASLLEDALPPGVLQVVYGTEFHGRILAAADDVDAIAFAGSPGTGRHIHGAASAALRRAIFEVRGERALIVSDDVDIDRAARTAARVCFEHAGELSAGAERIIAPAGWARPLAARLGDAARAFADSPAAAPMISARHQRRALDLIADAARRGAEVVAGGHNPGGLYVAPTVLLGVTSRMAIRGAITRAPIACVTEVASEDDAAREVDGGPFSTSALILAGDRARARRLAARLRADVVGINSRPRRAWSPPSLTPGHACDPAAPGHRARAFAVPRALLEPGEPAREIGRAHERSGRDLGRPDAAERQG